MGAQKCKSRDRDCRGLAKMIVNYQEEPDTSATGEIERVFA